MSNEVVGGAMGGLSAHNREGSIDLGDEGPSYCRRYVVEGTTRKANGGVVITITTMPYPGQTQAKNASLVIQLETRRVRSRPRRVLPLGMGVVGTPSRMCISRARGPLESEEGFPRFSTREMPT